MKTVFLTNLRMRHLSLLKAKRKMSLRSILRKKRQRRCVVRKCQLGRKNQQGEPEPRNLQLLQSPVHLRKLHRSDHQQNERRQTMTVMQVQRRLLRGRSLKKLRRPQPLQKRSQVWILSCLFLSSSKDNRSGRIHHVCVSVGSLSDALERILFLDELHLQKLTYTAATNVF